MCNFEEDCPAMREAASSSYGYAVGTGYGEGKSTTAEGTGSTDCHSSSIARGYVYGGPPEIVRLWSLRDHLSDFLDGEIDAAIIAAVKRLLRVLKTYGG